MASYLARVELHGAKDEEDYEELRTAMEKRGFVRQIKGDDGISYLLPTGTYVLENTSVMLVVAYNGAAWAADTTGFAYNVIVVDWSAARFALPSV